MKLFKMRLVALIAIVFYYGHLSGQNRIQEFETILKSQFSEDSPGGAILIAKEDRILYRNAMGLANLEKQMSLKPEHTFRIGSITKQFTAMAILKLAYEGKLSLQDSIQKFIPGFTRNTSAIRIAHLLNHTSGLQNQQNIAGWDSITSEKKITPIKLINLFKHKKPAFEPGSSYQYSNLGYMVLTHIIEVVAQQSYGEYLTSNFFVPLGMKNTGYGDEGINRNGVVGYSRNHSGYKQAAYLNMDIPQGAGGLVSTVDDLYKWNQAVFSGEGPGKYLGDSHRPSRLNNGKEFAYGNGWQLGQVQGRKAIKHDGIINGFVSYQLYLPKEKTYVVILTNCDCTEKIVQLAAKLAAVAIDDSYVYKGMDLSKDILKKYQGMFASNTGAEKIVQLQDGVLYYFSKGGRKLPLLPLTKNKFHEESELEKLTFVSNETGAVVRFDLENLDLPSAWTKVQNINALNSIPTSRETLKKYCGKYKFRNAFTLEVLLKDDQLVGAVGNDYKPLLRFAEHSFFTKFNDIKLVFQVDEKKAVTGLKLLQNTEIIADKIE